MKLFGNNAPIDKQYEYDQGYIAAEKNDRSALLRHCVRLLADDRTNPDGWILRAALQLHGKDFDIEKVSLLSNSLLSRTVPITPCRDALNSAYSSYKRAISYSKDDSRLYDYVYIFGYSLAFELAKHFHSENLDKKYGSTIARMLEETNVKFGHDCSTMFYKRIIDGYEQFMATGVNLSMCCYEVDVKKVHSILLSLGGFSRSEHSAGPFENEDEEDDSDEDDEFFEDEDREVTLSIIKGKKSCAEYEVNIYLDDELICELCDELSAKVKVITAEYCLRITAEDCENSLELTDDISIEDDGTLKIKISYGELEYDYVEE